MLKNMALPELATVGLVLLEVALSFDFWSRQYLCCISSCCTMSPSDQPPTAPNNVHHSNYYFVFDDTRSFPVPHDCLALQVPRTRAPRECSRSTSRLLPLQCRCLLARHNRGPCSLNLRWQSPSFLSRRQRPSGRPPFGRSLQQQPTSSSQWTRGSSGCRASPSLSRMFPRTCRWRSRNLRNKICVQNVQNNHVVIQQAEIEEECLFVEETTNLLDQMF